VNFAAVGVFLFLTIIALLGAFVWWQRQRRRAVSDSVNQAVRSVSAARRLLVPVKGTSYSDRAIELACRLGQAQKADIVLVSVIEVPLSLSLDTPLDEPESKAREVLDRGSQIVKLHHLNPILVIRRDRDVAPGILAAAQEHQADLVVLGVNPRRITAGDSIGASIESVLKRSGIEVIVDMVPETVNREFMVS
jgi:nucleotide-binding universal stress UspA family protein